MAQKVIVCPDCQNDISLEEDRKYQVGDIIECQTCGTELEVVEVTDSGEIKVEPIEEEK